ncbi:MAG: stage 0 sporulation family protein [Eubacteriales bacterium]|nr:stage 0 sporulation family protein [Eubacteriales bacterium]
MVEIIGIKFKNGGKVYFFNPNGIEFAQGEKAIVETARGVEIGLVCLENKLIPEEELVSPLKDVLRKATKEDEKIEQENIQKEKDAIETCLNLVKQHNLDMHLINAEYTFDRNKLLFYFTADGRVDFRDLVKSLASAFKTRIELRQIGVRDEAKLIGGLGICGRPLCCATFLGDFEPVSIKMAKEQSLSLNPSKISGTCGRLMCCLKYEQEAYEHLLKKTPKVDAIVKTVDGKGVVVEANILRGIIKVKLDKSSDGIPKQYNVDDVAIIKDAVIKVSKEELAQLKDLEK